MPESRTITVYTAQELTGDARNTALEWLARGNTDHDWYDVTIEDAKRLCALFGLTIDDVQFSGFSSQGDGASLTGSYAYKAGGLAALQQEAPTEEKLHAAVRELQRIQRSRGYKLTATIERNRGDRYVHPRSVTTTAYDSQGDEHGQEVTDAVAEAMRDVMTWIYRQLEAEYEYQTSEEACLESADANDYRFDKFGRPIHHLTD